MNLIPLVLLVQKHFSVVTWEKSYFQLKELSFEFNRH